MYKKLEETFTNDLRYRSEIVSLNQNNFEEVLAEEEKQTTYSPEQFDLVWNTLKNLYSIDEDKYIVIYLIYYLGFSYRDAATVLGISVSWCHDLTEGVIHKLQEAVVHEQSTT